MTAALVMTDDPIDGDIVAAIDGWIRHQRWFPAKGEDVTLAPAGGAWLPAEADRPRLLLVRVDGDRRSWLLQVPLVIAHADTATDGEDPARTGAADTDLEATGPASVEPAVTAVSAPGTRTSSGWPVGDSWVVRDGSADPSLVAAWLRAAGLDPAAWDAASARALNAEQSNTSVLVPAAPGTGSAALLKTFRVVAAGANPEVEVPLAIGGTGWARIPPLLAWCSATWDGPSGQESGHLSTLTTFLAGATDGFTIACAAATQDTPFVDEASALGRTIAELHAALASALPVGGSGSPDSIAASVMARWQWASSIVPELAERRSSIERLAAAVSRLAAVPAPQRIHGDLHLGQVLRSGDAWFVIDFEGEPQAPVSERVRPDIALRDVAGMLRSFDYAAAVGHGSDGWRESARAAFLRGYLGGDGTEASRTESVLLAAMEADKAMYECVYEAGNRPDWLVIPLAALDRVLRSADQG